MVKTPLMKGDAEAFAITARATAEAEGMNMKAEAFREYKKAAKVALWTEALPSMAAEVSAPLSQCDKVRGGEVVLQSRDGRQARF